MGFIMPMIPVSRKFTLSISWKIFSNEGSKKYCPACLTISFRKESSFLFVFVLHVSFNINYVHGVLLAWSVFLRFHHLANFLFHPSHLQNLYFHLFHCYHKVNVKNKMMVDYVCILSVWLINWLARLIWLNTPLRRGEEAHLKIF